MDVIQAVPPQLGLAVVDIGLAAACGALRGRDVGCARVCLDVAANPEHVGVTGDERRVPIAPVGLKLLARHVGSPSQAEYEFDHGMTLAGGLGPGGVGWAFEPSVTTSVSWWRALFTEDTHFVVYMNGQGSEPTQVLDGREALTPVFDDLNRYQATSTSTVRARSRSTATGRPARATASPTTCSPRTASAS